MLHRLANQGKFTDAIVDFKSALASDPAHVNAAAFLAATEQKVSHVML